MDDQLKELLKKHADLSYDNKLNRVVCKYTGHQLPGKYDAIFSYVNCKKYKMACAKALIENSEFLKKTDDPKHRNQLHCSLTWRFINDIPSHIQRHLEGRRFQKALKRYELCKIDGIEFVPNTSKFPGNKMKQTAENEDLSNGQLAVSMDLDQLENENDNLDENGSMDKNGEMSGSSDDSVMDEIEVVPSKKRKMNNISN